jgi:PhoPQ-activated pathogenicity-related protein
MSALFDFSQRFTTTGTLTKVDWRNPHIYVFVDAKNEKGQVETWSFEGPAPGFFRQRDVGKENFESSMQKSIKVEASRARDGSHAGLIREITLADGKLVSACPQNC